MELSFRTPLKYSHVTLNGYKYDSENRSIDEINAFVDWKMKFIKDSQGIKDTIFTIEKIDLKITLEEDQDDDEIKTVKHHENFIIEKSDILQNYTHFSGGVNFKSIMLEFIDISIEDQDIWVEAHYSN